MTISTGSTPWLGSSTGQCQRTSWSSFRKYSTRCNELRWRKANGLAQPLRVKATPCCRPTMAGCGVPSASRTGRAITCSKSSVIQVSNSCWASMRAASSSSRSRCAIDWLNSCWATTKMPAKMAMAISTSSSVKPACCCSAPERISATGAPGTATATGTTAGKRLAEQAALGIGHAKLLALRRHRPHFDINTTGIRVRPGADTGTDLPLAAILLAPVVLGAYAGPLLVNLQLDEFVTGHQPGGGAILHPRE